MVFEGSLFRFLARGCGEDHKNKKMDPRLVHNPALYKTTFTQLTKATEYRNSKLRCCLPSKAADPLSPAAGQDQTRKRGNETHAIDYYKLNKLYGTCTPG